MAKGLIIAKSCSKGRIMSLSYPPPTPSAHFAFDREVCLMQAIARRVENRIPLTVRVDLCSLDIRHPAQEALTENISAHGVRVVASNPWKRNERLNLWALPGDFRARARVVYCEPLGVNSFAIGLQLLASSGGWK
jgi:PilZ domain